MAICKFKNLNKIIKKEKLEICVVSYGGSCCMSLVTALEKNGYTCQTKVWDKILCHCPKYIDLDIPVIYVYDNPMKSYLSMKRRGVGYWDVNQRKLSNNKKIELSDENLFDLMFKQHRSWTRKKRKNVLVIKSNELFDSHIKYKLQNFLQNYTLDFFPIEYITPKTSIENIDTNDIKIFEKYVNKIAEINKKREEITQVISPFVKKNYETIQDHKISLLVKKKINENIEPENVNLEHILIPIIKNALSDSNYEKINKLLTNFATTL
jgi:hypothetical protein